MELGSIFVRQKKYFLKIFLFLGEKEELIICTSKLLYLTTLIPAVTPAGLVAD